MAESNEAATIQQSASPIPDYPHFKRDRLDFWRVGALFTAVITILFLILVVTVPQEPKNDIGSLDSFDIVGFPFYIVSILVNTSIVSMQLYTRSKHRKGATAFKGYYLPLPLLAFLDFAVFGGCCGWGGLMLSFAFLGENGIFGTYSFAMLVTGLFHLKLFVSVCRYMYFGRRERRKRASAEIANIRLADLQH